MVFLLYPLGLLASVGFLALWFLYQDRGGWERLVKPLFFISLLVYGTGLLLGSADWADKGGILFRDMIIMSVIPAGLSLLKNQNRLFLLLLAGMLIPLFFFARKSAFTLSEPSALHEGEWELLVDLHTDYQAEDLTDLLEAYKLHYEAAFEVRSAEGNDLREVIAIEIPEHLEAQESSIIAALREHQAVEWVEQNERIQLSPDVTTWAPFRPGRGAINDPELEKQWARDVMQIEKVHRLLDSRAGKAQKTALIAILDTGVDGQHEDLKGRYRSTNKKYDADPVGHGTHCAGIAAAISNNKKGIASLTPDKGWVQVTSIKVLSGFGGGTQRGIIQGMLEAADAGADVISMSLGGFSTDKRQLAYQEAVAYARQKGAIVVAAAGNENQDARKVTPANAPGLITVTAVDTVLGRASFANWVTDLERPLSAPGVAIYSTTPKNTYKSYNGTSMAAPQVAGLLGIMKSLWPEIDTDQAYEILKTTSRKSGQPKETGPLVQPYEALVKTIEQRPNS
ncbi:MAG: S8 family serine peptidase [Bacteroidota bacterium]